MPAGLDSLVLFPHLENFSIESIASWLKRDKDLKFVANELGNYLLYPDTIPVTVRDLLFDLALLREALKIDSRKYFSPNLKRIYLSQSLLDRFPDLFRLIWIFIDVLDPAAVTSIFLKTEKFGTKNLGSLIRPKIISPKSELTIWTGKKKYRVKADSLVVIPAKESKADIKVEMTGLTLLGKNNFSMEVSGGEVGLIIDTRTRPLKNHG